MGETIVVGMADMKMCRVPDQITTLGLGSCIGLALYEPRTHISALLHIMLPDSTTIKDNSNVAKFADTAIAKILQDFKKCGISPFMLNAKMAGGAKMFAFNNNDVFSVGKKNADAIKAILSRERIKLIAEDCGGNYGRTVVFSPEDFSFTIKSIGKQPVVI